MILVLTFWWWLRDHREGGAGLLLEWWRSLCLGECGSARGYGRGNFLRWCGGEGGCVGGNRRWCTGNGIRRFGDLKRAYIWEQLWCGAGWLEGSC